MKVVICPHCGKVAATLSLGRAASNIGVIEVCDALHLSHSILLAAESLGCSRALIYKILKANGMTPVEVIKGKVTV
jgi:hypothetical protein